MCVYPDPHAWSVSSPYTKSHSGKFRCRQVRAVHPPFQLTLDDALDKHEVVDVLGGDVIDDVLEGRGCGSGHRAWLRGRAGEKGGREKRRESSVGAGAIESVNTLVCMCVRAR